MKKKQPSNLSLLWQSAAYGYTAQNAAESFARTYWDRPRKVIWNGDDTFRVEDGVRVYRVVFKPAREDRPALYQVSVLNSGS